MIKAIVYTSNAGSTAKYAQMLGEKLNLPVCALKDAKLERGDEVIFLGWLMAGTIKGYKAAAKKYILRAACAVGMAPSGAMVNETCAQNLVPPQTKLFTLQGNFDMAKLGGIYRLMMKAMIGGLQRKQRTEKEEAMLRILTSGENYVHAANLDPVVQWYKRLKA